MKVSQGKWGSLVLTLCQQLCMQQHLQLHNAVPTIKRCVTQIYVRQCSMLNLYSPHHPCVTGTGNQPTDALAPPTGAVAVSGYSVTYHAVMMSGNRGCCRYGREHMPIKRPGPCQQTRTSACSARHHLPRNSVKCLAAQRAYTTPLDGW